MVKNKIYSTKEAAKFLGLSIQGIKHHVYYAKDLVPSGKVGQSIYFTRANLQRFRPRPPGRPPLTK